MQFFHDPAHFRHEPVDKYVRGPQSRLQQGNRSVHSIRVVDFPLLADAHDKLPRKTHDQ